MGEGLYMCAYDTFIPQTSQGMPGRQLQGETEVGLDRRPKHPSPVPPGAFRVAGSEVVW